VTQNHTHSLPLPAFLYKLLMKLDSVGSISTNNSSSSALGAATVTSSELDGILSLSDLWECDAGLAHGMQQLLDYNDGSSIPDVFGVTFTASENPLDPQAPMQRLQERTAVALVLF
jgi:hypothetical protein